jgi:hypothetical protein
MPSPMVPVTGAKAWTSPGEAGDDVADELARPLQRGDRVLLDEAEEVASRTGP